MNLTRAGRQLIAAVTGSEISKLRSAADLIPELNDSSRAIHRPVELEDRLDEERIG